MAIDQRTIGRDRDEALYPSASTLTTLIDSLLSGILLEDTFRKIILVNRACGALLGAPSPEMIIGTDGRRLTERAKELFVAPEEFAERVEKIVRDHAPVHGEELRLKDGRTFERDYVPIDAGGARVGHLWHYRDITERKRAEEKLRQSESQLAEAQHLTGVGSWNWDRHTNMSTWSAELYPMFGVSPETFVTTHDAFLERVHPEDREYVRIRLDTALEERTHLDYHFRIVRPDGTVRILHSRGNVFTDEHGSPTRMFGAVQDVTERMLAEEQLRRQLDFIEAISASMGEGVYALDANGRLTFMNPAAETALGWNQAELLGRETHELIHFQHEDGTRRPPEACPLVRVLKTGRTVKVESDVFTRKDGSVFPVSYTSSPIISGGEVIGAVLAFHDITERKNAELILQTFSQRLIETQEAERHRVARELHDEVGQVLTAIKINLNAIRQHPADPTTLAGRLDESTAIVERALQQVRDLSFNLRPSLLDDLGLVIALRWYVDREAGRAGFHAHFVADQLQKRLPAELETACFRIAQEALTNVARHAAATHVWVELHQRGTDLHLTIRDDGVGFDVRAVRGAHASDGSLGLRGMQERALILAGNIEIASAPALGTEVHAWFDLGAFASPHASESDMS
jgi:PAS domain S-box-containing protein